MRGYSLFLILFSAISFAQPNTEVYLFDLKPTDDGYVLENKRNISNNEGYDNQPSFYNDNQVLFAATRNDQTDIAAYNVRDNTINWINATGQGSEYSPTKIPGQKAISSIRLDTTGLQRLYRYDYKTGKDKELIKDLVIGYHTWFNENIVVSAVLADGQLDLVVSNLKNKRNDTLQKKIGRSLHKIPNTQQISYISKENDIWEIRSLDPLTGETVKIINTIPEAEDMCWLLNGTILMPKNNVIYKFNSKTDTNWSIFKSFNNSNIWNISRVSTNAISNQLALVSEVSPEAIVQRQMNSYNARNIDDFISTFTNNIEFFNFPEESIIKGKEAVRERYELLFKDTPDLHYTVKSLIVQGNKVIDEEYITANGKSYTLVAIYEINGGLISKATFIRK